MMNWRALLPVLIATDLVTLREVLTCHAGTVDPFFKDRVGQGARDENAEIRVDNLALCVLGGIQPDRLAQIKDLTSDGLLQRYLLIAVQAPLRGDENYPAAVAEGGYAKLIQRAHQALPRTYNFNPDAAEVRRRVIDRLHNLEQLQGFAAALVGAIGELIRFSKPPRWSSQPKIGDGFRLWGDGG